MLWLITEYEAVTLFSLKQSSATASGGKTLLVPTPYAVKMALLDAACRLLGAAEAEARWPQLRDLGVAVRPADHALVSNLFQKVLRPRKRPAAAGDPDFGPFQKTIGYREYVHLIGPWGLALGVTAEATAEWLTDLLVNLTYLGKRGGFVQMVAPPRLSADLPPDFTEVTREQAAFVVNGTLQVLDDCGPTLTFAKANIYSGERVRLGQDRITRNIVLPYRLVRASKAYTLYERTGP